MGQFHWLSSYLGDIGKYGGGLHVSAGVGIGHVSFLPSEAVVIPQVQESAVKPTDLESNLNWLAIVLYLRFSSSIVAQQVSFVGK
jgi:hypothetical protein